MPNKKSKHAVPDTLTPDQLDVLRNSTPAQQHARDAAVWQAYLNAPVTSSTELARRDIMRRIFTLADDPGFKYRNSTDDKNSFYMTDDLVIKPQLAAKLSHGGRMVFQIPPLENAADDPNKFFNWLLTGNPSQKPDIATSKNAAQYTPVKQRNFATHDLYIDEQGNVREQLLDPKNIKHAQRFATNLINKRHFGMDLGLGEPDAAAEENGYNGHLYMYYLPPTATTPGAVMVGVESSAPGHADRFGGLHGPSGKSPEFSPTGGLKSTNEKFKNELFKPDRVDGMRVELTQDKINNLYKMDHNKLIKIDAKVAQGAENCVNAFDKPSMQSSNGKTTDNNINLLIADSNKLLQKLEPAHKNLKTSWRYLHKNLHSLLKFIMKKDEIEQRVNDIFEVIKGSKENYQQLKENVEQLQQNKHLLTSAQLKELKHFTHVVKKFEGYHAAREDYIHRHGMPFAFEQINIAPKVEHTINANHKPAAVDQLSNESSTQENNVKPANFRR